VSSAIEVRVPNIGDYKDVPVIDVFVKPGDRIAAEDPLVALESDKATMDVPSPSAGVVESVSVKVGDRVSEGATIVMLASDVPAAADAPVSAGPAAAAPTPVAASIAPQASAPAASTPAPAASAPASAEKAATTTIDVRVPNIGDFEKVLVIDVFVKPGDAVRLEDALLTLESEKAAMDVPSPAEGVVASVAIKPGDKVSEGDVILTLATTAKGAKPDATPHVASAPATNGSALLAAADHAPTTASPEPATQANSEQTERDRVAPTLAAPSTNGTDASRATPSVASTNGASVHASPSIRRFARELGVDLHAVHGTGPHARITRDDVQNFVKDALRRPAAAAPATAPASGGFPYPLAPWPKIDFAQFGPIEEVELSRIKRISGPNLARNWVAIPHVTNNDEADVTDLETLRKTINAEQPDAKLTMLAFAILAVVATLKKFPLFNSSLAGDKLIRKGYYNIGFAADTPNGLVVPVLKNADAKGVVQIAAETRALAAKAREGKLGLGDMQGGTFTLSSLGGIGGTSFTPIINAPEVAILGLSRAALKPHWNGSAFEPRLFLPLSLSYDHRVIDGADAARFNAHLASLLADFRRVVL
jgi:pyruvate dehydrogenase E2 component (dihydrolipoamide acetyltransferase)